MEGKRLNGGHPPWPDSNQVNDHRRTRRWRRECRAANVHPDATHERDNVRETDRENAADEVGSRDRIPKTPIWRDPKKPNCQRANS